MLDFFVHLDRDDHPKDLVVVAADIPDGVSRVRLSAKDLAARWRHTPPPASLARLGDEFVLRQTAAILLVPSALAPAESNCLINPRHPEFQKIRIHRPEPFRFDARMVRSERPFGLPSRMRGVAGSERFSH